MKLAKMFDMALPLLSEMADKADVEIGIPRANEANDNGKPT